MKKLLKYSENIVISMNKLKAIHNNDISVVFSDKGIIKNNETIKQILSQIN
jgi:hypothetical protein